MDPLNPFRDSPASISFDPSRFGIDPSQGQPEQTISNATVSQEEIDEQIVPTVDPVEKLLGDASYEKAPDGLI